MALLNYTTTIAAEKTVGEIQKLLAKAGAKRMMMEFDGEDVSTLVFELPTSSGPRSFQLPANVEGVLGTLERQKSAGKCSLPWSKINSEQACRVAWRIIKDWLEAQLALVETQQATIEQVMLPYLLVAPQTTLYDVMKETHFALPAPK